MASQTRSVNRTVTGQWTSPDNAFTENDQCTSTSSDGFYNTYDFFNDPFTIPGGATILGLEARTIRGGDADDYYTVALADPIVRTKTGTAYSASCAGGAAETLGAPDDLWGGSWTAAHISSSSFTCRISYHKAAKANILYVDHIQVTVYYSTGPTETTLAQDYPPTHLETPVTAAELRSTVSGATVTDVANDFPPVLVKAGKAAELRSKWS